MWALKIAFKSLAMALYLYFTHETSSCWKMGKKNPSYSGVAYRSHNTRLIHLYNQKRPFFFFSKKWTHKTTPFRLSSHRWWFFEAHCHVAVMVSSIHPPALPAKSRTESPVFQNIVWEGSAEPRLQACFFSPGWKFHLLITGTLQFMKNAKHCHWKCFGPAMRTGLSRRLQRYPPQPYMSLKSASFYCSF